MADREDFSRRLFSVAPRAITETLELQQLPLPKEWVRSFKIVEVSRYSCVFLCLELLSKNMFSPTVETRTFYAPDWCRNKGWG